MEGIKVIAFDLDGVLISSKDLHFRAFNDALIFHNYEPIDYETHINLYDGLPTRKKIAFYFDGKLSSPLLDIELEKIYSTKQKITKELLSEYVKYDQKSVDLMISLRDLGYKVYIATNSIKESTEFILERMGIINFIDGYVTNQDVKNPKPHPECYIRIMAETSVRPSELLVLEDSPIGIKAAEDSFANIFIVKKMCDVNLKNILNRIQSIEPMSNSNKQEDVNVLIPMAGEGSRFQKAGYTFPKPLIEVNKEPMIKVVVDSLNFNSKHIYIVRSDHYNKYSLSSLLPLISRKCEIVQIDKLTEGAACTALLAEEFIDNDKELIIANSDQFVEWDSGLFLYTLRNKDADGGILTFESSHPKWSYAKADKYNVVSEVAEKKPISNKATVGIYYWKKGSDFVKYAKQMIEKDIRTNGEFYIAPVFNEAIGDGKKVLTFDIEKDKMWGLGTPEDLKYFLDNHDRPQI